VRAALAIGWREAPNLHNIFLSFFRSGIVP